MSRNSCGDKQTTHEAKRYQRTVFSRAEQPLHQPVGHPTIQMVSIKQGRLLSAHMQPIKQVTYGLNWINLRCQILTYGANMSTYFLPPGHENEKIQGVIPGGAF